MIREPVRVILCFLNHAQVTIRVLHIVIRRFCPLVLGHAVRERRLLVVVFIVKDLVNDNAGTEN